MNATIPDYNATDRAVRALLTDNTKLRKIPTGDVVINAGVSLAPAKRSGVVNVCLFATAGCIAACVLWFAGRTVTTVVRKAAVARTKLWHFYPSRFYARLNRSLVALAKRAHKRGARAFCRLNVASDIDHRPTDTVDGVDFARHPAVTFYDYTKSIGRCIEYAAGEFPANYHCSYSLHENTKFADVSMLIAAGVNIVAVVDSYYFGPRHRYGVLPATIRFVGPHGQTIDVPTVDGDVHDLRTPEFDGRGVVVCLRLKGGRAAKAKARASGFARAFAGGSRWFVDELVRDGVATFNVK